jgi:hypothetical protein
MMADATDLIVDARGSFLIASATPSSGQRAINWVSADGSAGATTSSSTSPCSSRTIP